MSVKNSSLTIIDHGAIFVAIFNLRCCSCCSNVQVSVVRYSTSAAERRRRSVAEVQQSSGQPSQCQKAETQWHILRMMQSVRFQSDE
uniref:Secreted protein n=1 Tax=Romanomermis culicivorax TaxID=13658 RepID=A0A915K5L0_ROMCU